MATATQKVLIVEDEPALSNVINEKLKDTGFSTDVASNGADALKKYKSYQPDIILIDVIMPVMSGFDFLEKLRLDEKSTTPVIIISNLEMKNDIETGKNLGAQQYIVKSNTSMRDLVLAVKQALAA